MTAATTAPAETAPADVPAVVLAATRRLAAAGVISPRADAEQLAAYVLGVNLGQLPAQRTFDPAAASEYAELVASRARRMPLQHLTGTVGFRYLDLVVGPGVFVPRPETESVVQAAVEVLVATAGPAPVVVEVGTGSGAIALALATEVPGTRVYAVERDPVALSWAARNLARYPAVSEAVTLHLGDAAALGAAPGSSGAVLPELAGAVDLVVSNPPYLRTAQLPGLEPEVRDHDPRSALAAGADGLAGIRMVATAARRLLRSGGVVVVEHSDDQGVSAPAVFTAAGGWYDVIDSRDWAGRDRFVTARRSADIGRPS